MIGTSTLASASARDRPTGRVPGVPHRPAPAGPPRSSSSLEVPSQVPTELRHPGSESPGPPGPYRDWYTEYYTGTPGPPAEPPVITRRPRAGRGRPPGVPRPAAGRARGLARPGPGPLQSFPLSAAGPLPETGQGSGRRPRAAGEKFIWNLALYHNDIIYYIMR
jgi:hypothetical protein